MCVYVYVVSKIHMYIYTSFYIYLYMPQISSPPETPRSASALWASLDMAWGFFGRQTSGMDFFGEILLICVACWWLAIQNDFPNYLWMLVVNTQHHYLCDCKGGELLFHPFRWCWKRLNIGGQFKLNGAKSSSTHFQQPSCWNIPGFLWDLRWAAQEKSTRNAAKNIWDSPNPPIHLRHPIILDLSFPGHRAA